MRRSRALVATTIGVSAAMVVAACSGSSSPGKNNASSPKSGSPSSSSSGALPLQTNEGSGSPVKGGTLHMLGTGDVDYLDPNITYYTIGQLVTRMYERGLFNYPAIPGKTTDPEPDLATQIPTQANGGISSDGLTYKVTIKTGAKWNTNPPRQVTAADEVRGVKRSCNPAQPFGGMPDFQDLLVGMAAYCAGFAKVNPKSASAIANYQNSHTIAGVTVDPSNPQTVVFKLTHPASYFVPMIGGISPFVPVPQEYDQYIPASAQLAQHTIADGPYQITKYVATKEIDFSRNPAWDPSTDSIRKAYVDKIIVTETGNQDSNQEQLQANTSGADMEFDSFPPNTKVPQLVATKDPNFNLQPGYSSNPYIVFNTVSPNNNKALQNVKVRQAISEALNRNNLIQDCGGPLICPPLTHFLPGGISGSPSNTSPSYYPYNVTKAKSDLAAAGASHLTLKFLYRPSSSTSKSMFLTVQQDLSKAGITVTGVTATPQNFYTSYLQVPSVAKRGVWDLSLAGWGSDWYGDAAVSWFSPLVYGNDGKAGSAYPPNGSDFGFYNNANVNSLTQQASKTADASQASQLWQQADKQVMDDAAIFPITADNQPTYHASHVHNTIYIPAIQQIDPTNVWLSNS